MNIVYYSKIFLDTTLVALPLPSILAEKVIVFEHQHSSLIQIAKGYTKQIIVYKYSSLLFFTYSH